MRRLVHGSLLLACLLTLVSSPSLAGPPWRILFVNSYHQGYEWSDGIETAFVRALDAQTQGAALEGRGPVEVRFFRMDTKRNPSEKQVLAAAEEASGLIASWKPDLVATSDDNAAKHVVARHFASSSLPFVFCGVNWDETPYGFPAPNVTGMVEVQLIGPMIDALRPFARGGRVAFLKGDDESARKETENFQKAFSLKLDLRFVKDFAQWKEEYRKLQEEADILLLGNPASVRGWDEREAKALVAEVTRVPSANWDAWMAPYALLTFSTIPDEQGEWVAKTALRILKGTKPGDIPVVRNKKARTFINSTLAKKLGVKLPMALAEHATFVELK